MLQQKWETRDKFGNVKQRQRDATAWEESMKHRWAILQLMRDEEADKAKGPPTIKKLEEELPRKKSDNELLQEMRLGDAKKAEYRPPASEV